MLKISKTIKFLTHKCHFIFKQAQNFQKHFYSSKSKLNIFQFNEANYQKSLKNSIIKAITFIQGAEKRERDGRM